MCRLQCGHSMSREPACLSYQCLVSGKETWVCWVQASQEIWLVVRSEDSNIQWRAAVVFTVQGWGRWSIKEQQTTVRTIMAAALKTGFCLGLKSPYAEVNILTHAGQNTRAVQSDCTKSSPSQFERAKICTSRQSESSSSSHEDRCLLRACSTVFGPTWFCCSRGNTDERWCGGGYSDLQNFLCSTVIQ